MNTTAILLLVAILLILIAVYLLWWLYMDRKREKGEDVEILPRRTNQDEMTQILVHDLRAPVVAIKDSASLLKSGKLNVQDQKEMLNLIYEQSDKVLFQISTILDAAKVSQGKLALKKEMADLGNLVKEELVLFESEAKNKNITVTHEIASGLPQFYFDKIRIAEALNNVLSNSLKYTNENGLIKVFVKPQGESAAIIVSDNGIGIPKDMQKDLFKKYAQLSSNNKTRKNSSGLGLYITKWIISTHGGTIKVDSIEGEGTTTTIAIPMLTKP
jgi:signal transduction histidine kinase